MDKIRASPLHLLTSLLFLTIPRHHYLFRTCHRINRTCQPITISQPCLAGKQQPLAPTSPLPRHCRRQNKLATTSINLPLTQQYLLYINLTQPVHLREFIPTNTLPTYATGKFTGFIYLTSVRYEIRKILVSVFFRIMANIIILRTRLQW